MLFGVVLSVLFGQFDRMVKRLITSRDDSLLEGLLIVVVSMIVSA